MRPGATKIETDGSLWWFDDGEGQYLRLPKHEGPRPKGPNGEDWGGRGAGSLEDLRWHDMVRWEVRVMGGDGFQYRRLIIWLDDPDLLGGKARVVSAPIGPA